MASDESKHAEERGENKARKRPRMHHYLPVSYLNRFVDNDGFLHVVDMLEWKTFKSKPENVARERDYYTAVTVDSPEDDSTEKLIGTVEAKASPVIQAMIDRDELPDPDSDGWIDLCFFVALLDQRTPVARQIQQELDEGLQRFVAQHALGSRAAFERVLSHYREVTGDTRECTFEDAQALLRSGDFVRDMHRNEHLRMMLALSGGLVPLIADKTVQLLVADKADFVTGDCPLPQFNNANPQAYAGGWANPYVEVAFPIGRRHAMIFFWGDQRRVVRADTKRVANVNCQIAQKSRRFLYAPAETFCWMDPAGDVQWTTEALQRQLGDQKKDLRMVEFGPPFGTLRK